MVVVEKKAERIPIKDIDEERLKGLLGSYVTGLLGWESVALKENVGLGEALINATQLEDFMEADEMVFSWDRPTLYDAVRNILKPFVD